MRRWRAFGEDEGSKPLQGPESGYLTDSLSQITYTIYGFDTLSCFVRNDTTSKSIVTCGLV